ncbi:DMT family transporter [Chitiniphilus purpureus]|uniref:DMT family transporter n=1 Tax=Chitiniphilus purpureus TaxID=2981137 RepID=A0ABY6DP50_9NEIS|nr:DMT family transporter [Chitiniphilus sp. CD1]UXY16117.1 DMT family transporter [Chitiniphilus sp. CD1]
MRALPYPAPFWIADVMLLSVAVVWGTSYAVAKGVLAYYPVLGFIAIRFGLTFVLLLPALRGLAGTQGRSALRAGVPLGLLLLAIFACETLGIALTHAANAAFLISLCVVFTPFIEWALLRRRPTGSALIAAGVALAGAWLLAADLSGGMNVGDGLMLAAALLRALLVCVTARLTANHPVPVLALTAVQAGVVGAGSLIAGWLLPGSLPALPAVAGFWYGTLYLVLFCTLFAFFAQNYGLRHSSPSRVALLMGCEPAFGALFANYWLGERLSSAAWLGGALMVAAAIWAALPRDRSRGQAARDR